LSHNKINVLSLSTTYPESHNSIKPKFVHLLNKELVKLGVYVKVITPHIRHSLTTETLDSVNLRRFRYLPSKYELDRISIPDVISRSRFGVFKVAIMCLSFFVFTFFECLKEQPDIIHGQWAFPGGYFSFIIAKIFRKKSIISIHGAETPLLNKFRIIRRLTIHSLNKSSKVIVNSNYTKDVYVKMGVNENKIIKINPIPNFLQHVSDNALLKKFKTNFTNEKSRIITFVGRLVERKGIEYLIKAVSETKTENIHLIIAGSGWLLNDLKKLTCTLELENKITFFENPSDEDLGKLYGITDVFVLPSIIDSKGETEGLGLVILEAMNAGIPVVATSVGGIKDIIKHEVNGLLVNQKDPKDIAKAIQRIISDEELKRKIVENSKKTVMEFTPSTIAQKYYEIYEKIVT